MNYQCGEILQRSLIVTVRQTSLNPDIYFEVIPSIIVISYLSVALSVFIGLQTTYKSMLCPKNGHRDLAF